ncbi:MAG: hypothetical protein NT125_01235, partial [Candidatus Bipolaricaulota bacterium]|nr:hypothetical protein [Candidatus Bipolaricaulota bacterium]
SFRGGGGGGYGSPLERDPDKVLEDVLNEYVSCEKAKEDYGVVIEKGAVDLAATKKLRETLKKGEKKEPARGKAHRS